MSNERVVARKAYENGGWGIQHASLAWEPGRFGMAGYWVVSAWDRWAHRTLAEAKAHYRRIGKHSA